MPLGKSDDSDMKIVGSQPEKKDHFDASAIVDEAREQRFNGNSAKAKALGANIVSSFSYKAAPDDLRSLAGEYGIEFTDELLLQIKILSVFSAEYCLQRYLPSPMLSATAVGEMYEVLEELSPEFYEQLSNSSAFSFYYLCIKGLESKKSAAIGECFAMLCGKKGDKNLSLFGKKLHEVNKAVYSNAIDSFAFV